MYHGNELSGDKRRPRKQPPNQVWLDAIMSKSRSAEPSPLSGMRPVVPPSGDPAAWRQPSPSHFKPPTPTYYPPMPPASRSSRSPSPMVPPVAIPPRYGADHHHHHQNTTPSDAALAAALATALKELVAEQECCFIARGICHLCGGTDGSLVPVINFCPAFSATHSLCREHLRSVHRVRLEDIFAGRNQPTVSKKSLRCSVCALACPCSTCQLDRDAEFAKFTHLLRAEPEATDPVYGMPRRRSRDEETRRDAALAELKGRAYERYEEDKPAPQYDDDDAAYEYAPPDSERDESMVADAKTNPPPISGRIPKRAAKESAPFKLDLARKSTPRDATEEMEDSVASPSAARVLNCPESERSLVDLLSSLNQRVTPAVRYVAEADSDDGERVLQPKSHRIRPETEDDEDVEPYQPRKRKRDAGKPVAEEKPAVNPPKEAKAAAPKQRTTAEAAEYAKADSDASSSSSYRRKAPAPLSTSEKKANGAAAAPAPPTPSPRVLSSTRTKPAPAPVAEPKPSSRKRDAAAAAPLPSPPTSARKRKTEAAAVPVAVDRKSPRDSTHRGQAKTAAASRQQPPPPEKETTKPKKKKKGTASKRSRRADSDEEVIKYTKDDDEDELEEEDDDDEEEVVEVDGGGGDDDDGSELDANLDYCEVCLAAGDLVCCDVCPRSFHLSCLKMTERDLPEGEWQCAECQKPSYFESFAALVDAKTTVHGKCLQIIKCLKSHPFAKPFLAPVEDVPDYTAIVKEPMDLSTVQKKLVEGKYMATSSKVNLGWFATDVRRMWANCKLYNDDGSGITRAADHLSDGFEKLYQSTVEFDKRTAAKPATTIHPSGVARQEEKKKPATVAETEHKSEVVATTAASTATTAKATTASGSASPSPVTSTAASLTGSANASPTETTASDKLVASDPEKPVSSVVESTKEEEESSSSDSKTEEGDAPSSSSAPVETA